MKTKILLALIGVGALAVWTGCVGTVTGGHTPGLPGRDTVQGHYQRPLDQVFEAAKQVVNYNGKVNNESIDYSQTNMVKKIEGTVNQATVWVSVKAIEPQVTMVSVQARAQGGTTDIDLAHELEKQIAVKLATR